MIIFTAFFPVKNLTLTCKISTTRCVVLCFQFHHWDSREMCLETVQTSGALCLLWLYMQCWHCWDNLRLVNNFFVNIRELKQREQQKSNEFRLAKQQLCTCMTRFCTFLCRRCMTVTWKCLLFNVLSRTGPQDNNFVFLFLNFDRVL